MLFLGRQSYKKAQRNSIELNMSNLIENYFSVQVFFIVFRETIETAIIVSVLLAFIDQGFGKNAEPEATSTDHSEEDRIRIHRNLILQVWIGASLGLLICLLIGSIFVYAFFHMGKDLWFVTEKIWEGTFSILAGVIISFMGVAMLRINKMKKKWKLKIARSIINTHREQGYVAKRYAIAVLPFVTTLREGLEVVVFLGGIGANQPASSFPLPVITAVALGSFVGWIMYRTGDHMSIQYFLIASTCFLYLVAAGLISRGVWFFELQSFINHVGQDVSEQGSGPGSYDITKSLWHVNCCNSQTDGPWMIFNAILGWQNSATYGSVISYNMFWWIIIFVFYCLKYKEDHGHLPFAPIQYAQKMVRNWSGARAEEEALIDEATLLYTSVPDQTSFNLRGQAEESSRAPLINNAS